jgi:hypothetical protein
MHGACQPSTLTMQCWFWVMSRLSSSARRLLTAIEEGEGGSVGGVSS